MVSSRRIRRPAGGTGLIEGGAFGGGGVLRDFGGDLVQGAEIRLGGLQPRIALFGMGLRVQVGQFDGTT